MELIAAMKKKSFYDGFFTGDFKRRLDIEVSKTLALQDEHGSPPSLEDRFAIIEAMYDAFIEQTGIVPDGVQSQRLANWIMLESLTDNHPDKVTREDYPFMTKRQMRTRYRREPADELIPERHSVQSYLGGKKQSTFLKSE